MQLIRAHVTNYRPMENSDEFEIDPEVTCLVGKNESGKTSVLQALFRLNPITPAEFDEVLDFPSRLSRQLKGKPEGKMIPVVRATFRLSDDEIAEIEDDIGAGALTGRTITVSRGYRSQGRTIGFSHDEASIVRHLRGQLDIAPDGHPALADAATIVDFLEANGCDHGRPAGHHGHHAPAQPAVDHHHGV